MSTSLSSQFLIRFWGVRGSIPAPGKSTLRYGGNTSCIELCIGGRRLIFDGGTGLRSLCKTLKDSDPFRGFMFFTHYHWDHIQGVPFFTPIFSDNCHLTVYGNHTNTGDPVEKHFTERILRDSAPLMQGEVKAKLEFNDLYPGEKIVIDGDIEIRTGQLNHPNGAMGYRVTWGDKTVVYATDTEHLPDRLDENILELADGADMLVYDAMYTDEEYHNPRSSKVGWGHSTWQEGAKLAEAAGVERFVVFHHEPNHSDDVLDAIEIELKSRSKHFFIAREGMEVVV
ncbi:MAG: MBL fold metallo-hydrolase [Cyanophyceae cyanobacterium]